MDRESVDGDRSSNKNMFFVDELFPILLPQDKELTPSMIASSTTKVARK